MSYVYGHYPKTQPRVTPGDARASAAPRAVTAHRHAHGSGDGTRDSNTRRGARQAHEAPTHGVGTTGSLGVGMRATGVWRAPARRHQSPVRLQRDRACCTRHRVLGGSRESEHLPRSSCSDRTPQPPPQVLSGRQLTMRIVPRVTLSFGEYANREANESKRHYH